MTANRTPMPASLRAYTKIIAATYGLLLMACAAGGSGDEGEQSGDSAASALIDPQGSASAAFHRRSRARPPCLKRSEQVVLIGDSYMTWVSHTFPADLDREAHANFRNYALGGYSLATGGIGSIPAELDDALADDPDIIAAVVDGGGNDILVPDVFQFPQSWDCKNSLSSPTVPDCQAIIQRAVDAAITLMESMADAGVADIVYFFYPRVPDGTLIGGLHPNAILDYALPMAKAVCDGALSRTGGRLNCHFLDLVPVFANHPEYFAPTDIHPNQQGSARMAEAVWDTMKSACIAQPAWSLCCER